MFILLLLVGLFGNLIFVIYLTYWELKGSKKDAPKIINEVYFALKHLKEVAKNSLQTAISKL